MNYQQISLLISDKFEINQFCLNLVNIGSEIRKPSLIVNTICVWINLGNVQGTFFVVFTGADKIIKFTVCVRGGGEGGVSVSEGVEVKFWTFEVGEGHQNRTSANKKGGGFKLWVFCNNVVIVCPHLTHENHFDRHRKCIRLFKETI